MKPRTKDDQSFSPHSVETSLPEESIFERLRTKITSPALSINDEGDLLVRRNDQVAGEWHVVRLGTNLLPATELALQPRKFAQEIEVMMTITLVADRTLRMSTNKSNEQHSTIALAVATLCKLWEYLWINSVYSLRDAHLQHFVTLVVEFHAILTRHFHPILTHPLCEPGGSRCG